MPRLFKKKKNTRDAEKVLDELLAIRDENKKSQSSEEIDINDIIQFHIAQRDVDFFFNKKEKLRRRFEHILNIEQWQAVSEILKEQRRHKIKDEFLSNGSFRHSSKKRDKKLK